MGNVEMLMSLLACDRIDVNKGKPLHWAAALGHLDVVKELLKSEKEVDLNTLKYLPRREMVVVRDVRSPTLVEFRVIWQGLLILGDSSGKRLLRGTLNRRLRSLKTLTECRLQIVLSVRMMAKENKMVVSTT